MDSMADPLEGLALVREVLRLRNELGLGPRAIGHKLGVNARLVTATLRAAPDSAEGSIIVRGEVRVRDVVRLYLMLDSAEQEEFARCLAVLSGEEEA